MTGYTKGKKLLGPEDLLQAARQVVEIARGEDVSQHDEIRLALAGGLALQLYGSPRLTGDIDFLADDVPEEFVKGKALSFGGVATVAPNGVPVDFIVRSDKWRDLYEDALDNAVIDDEHDLDIVTPEYLVAMKMVASRDKDQLDLKFLIGIVDIEKAHAVIEEFLGEYAVDEFDRLVDEVNWEKERGR